MGVTIHGKIVRLVSALNLKMVFVIYYRYVFRGHPIGRQDERDDSLVHLDIMPTPKHIMDAISQIGGVKDSPSPPKLDRSLFVNAQWALGGEGTGAPVHFHNSAWSALVYGAKKWVIYPPHHAIMSNEQVLNFWEHSKKTFADRGIKGITCVQTAGDSMIIPEMWGHGVLNIQESVVVASELKYSHWRLRPSSTMTGALPSTNGMEKKNPNQTNRRRDQARKRSKPPA
jgi:hypothetical protein